MDRLTNLLRKKMPLCWLTKAEARENLKQSPMGSEVSWLLSLIPFHRGAEMFRAIEQQSTGFSWKFQAYLGGRWYNWGIRSILYLIIYIYIYVYIYIIYILFIYIYTYIAILETPVSPLRSLLVSSRTRWCVVSSVVIPKLHVGMLGGCCDGADVENEHIFFSLSEVVEGFFVLTRMFRLVHCDKIRLYDN